MNRIENIGVNAVPKLVFPDIQVTLRERFAKGQHELVTASVRRLKETMPQSYGEIPLWRMDLMFGTTRYAAPCGSCSSAVSLAHEEFRHSLKSFVKLLKQWIDGFRAVMGMHSFVMDFHCTLQRIYRHVLFYNLDRLSRVSENA